MVFSHSFIFFFFNDTATTEIYTLSLHDALPIFGDVVRNLPSGVVEVDAVDGGLTVRCGQVSHELRLLDAEDFPSLTQPSLENSATLPGDVLAAAAGQVARDRKSTRLNSS